MAEENKIIIEVQLDSKQAKKDAAQLTGEIAIQRKKLQELQKVLKEGKGKTQEQREAWGRAAKGVAGLNRAITENTKDLRNAQKEASAEANSIDALRASVSKLTKERNALNTGTVEGRKRFEELTESIGAQNTKLKELEGVVGDTRRNVGNYKADILGAIESNSMLSGALGEAQAAFKMFNITLLANPIGLIVTAIMLMIGAMTTFFTKTKEGQKIMKEFLAIVEGVFGKLTQDIAKVGKVIFETITNIDKFKDAMQRVFDYITTVSMDEFVEDTKALTKATGEYIDAIKETARQSQLLQKTRARGEGTIRRLTEEASIQQRIAEEQRKLRDDLRLTEAQRLQANARALEAEKLRREALLGINNENIKALTIQAKLKGLRSTADDTDLLNKEIELRKERQEIIEDFASRTTETQTEAFNIAREELQADANIQAAILENKLIQQNATIEEQLRLRLQILSKQEQAELAGLNENSKQAILIRQQFENQRLQARVDAQEQIQTVTESAQAKEVQSFIDTEQTKTSVLLDEEAKRLTAKQDALEKDKALADANAQIESIRLDTAKTITDGIATQLDRQTALGKIAFLASQAFSIADVVVKSNAARIAILAKNAFIPGGIALSAAEIANLQANTIVSIAGIIDATVSGFAEGGYTGDGGKYQPAGTVHKGEFVIPKSRVQSLGGASKVASLTGVPSKGYANGGMVGATTSSRVNSRLSNDRLSSQIAGMSIQVAVTDIQKATGKYNAVQAKVNS